MITLLDLPEELMPIAGAVGGFLASVERRFDEQLASDVLPVAELCRHVERYRGKMLRPALVSLCGMAAGRDARSRSPTELVTDAHVTIGAVCEMVHMATLVHDDVLDEADTRRGGGTVNHIRDNETAVILGDYLIAGAYHLCSQLDSQFAALTIGRVSMTLCAGEMIQLDARADWSIDERTYMEIIARKTGSLIGAACALGAWASGADEAMRERFDSFGVLLGQAFQIQDDLLDLSGREDRLGKPVGQDAAKGKLTLPVILALRQADAGERSELLGLLGRLASGDVGCRTRLVSALDRSGCIDSAREAARVLVDEARRQIEDLPDSPALTTLRLLADAVVDRAV